MVGVAVAVVVGVGVGVAVVVGVGVGVVVGVAVAVAVAVVVGVAVVVAVAVAVVMPTTDADRAALDVLGTMPIIIGPMPDRNRYSLPGVSMPEFDALYEMCTRVAHPDAPIVFSHAALVFDKMLSRRLRLERA